MGTISQDPIGFSAGDANLYRYVGNGPTNATDPNGLDEKKSGVLHSIDLALGRAVQWLSKRVDDSYHGRGGGAEIIQDQVQSVADTPKRFVENGDKIGQFPGQFRRRKLIAELADVKLQRIDRQIEDGTFAGDRTEARREIFEEGFAEIRETYRLQRDAVRASGELVLETALIVAPLGPKFRLRIAGQAGRSPLAPKSIANRNLTRTEWKALHRQSRIDANGGLPRTYREFQSFTQGRYTGAGHQAARGRGWAGYRQMHGIDSPTSFSGNWAWPSVRRRLGQSGWAESGQDVHHWLIPRNTWGSAIPDVIKNRKWNLMRMSSRSEHFRVHGWSFDGQPGYNLPTRLWRGTPTPAKLTVGGGVIVAGTGYYYWSDQ